MSSAVAQPLPPPATSPAAYIADHAAAQHYSPDRAASSPASSRRQPAHIGDSGPPNTPQQIPSSARQTPASRSSAAASQDPYYSGRSDQTSLPYRISEQKQPASSPASDRQDSTRTSVPFNTPELAAGFDPDRSRENAGSTPGAIAKREKREQRDHRIFTEPITASAAPSSQLTQSRSAGALADRVEQQQQQQRPQAERGDSTVINRLVVTDPSVDIEREQLRQLEAQPASSPHMPQPDSPIQSPGLGLVGSEGVEDGGRGAQQQYQQQQQQQDSQQQQQRSRQEHLRNNQPRREVRFGEYFLGQTVGEGEFGKVKLGWKGNGGVQVAIKLIRRESLGSNPNRLPKIYREISILRGLQHPNIVRLHEMVETERHIGIILEYASGGELFDYILNHRYLKDHHARRLFAQLVSGVGYLHKKGIVHRDLKLENLLLDRNKNIIITDFGFANTFNTNDELGEEIEYNLSNKDYVQRMGLEHVHDDGHRRGDLMQTSCGSPCYAAPELVVSDTLYTGRKVDVWSCGVILYAMLAGYLPFDDDPSNPEGDNINLLYKYIVSTPLTFPEYVTPHARDLLRRILVPDPRKRADLFEVARHSWLSDYAHVVGFITSTTATSDDLHQTTVAADAMDTTMPSGLGRSASTREPTRPSPKIGTAGRSPAIPSTEDRQKKDRDAKRRTVQLEYVAPQMATQRGEAPQPPASYAQGSSSRSGAAARPAAAELEAQPSQQPAATSSSMPPPMARNPIPRAASDSTAAFTLTQNASSSANRPSTRGSMAGNTGSRLPSRGNSYGQPSVAAVAPTTAEGRFSQPQRNSMILPAPISTDLPGSDASTTRPMSQQFPLGYAPHLASETRPKHKRTSTMESFTAKILGRSNSVRKNSQAESSSPRPRRENRQYPPVSMNQSMLPTTEVEISGPRRSTESRRSSFGFARKSSTGIEAETSKKDKRASKRFSFIPQALSRMSLSGPSTKDESTKESRRQSVIGPTPRSRHDSKLLSGLSLGPGQTPSPSTEAEPEAAYGVHEEPHRQRLPPHQGPQRGATAPDLTLFSPPSQQSAARQQQQTLSPNYRPASSAQQQQFYSPSHSAETQATEASTGLHPNFRPSYPQGFNDTDSRPSGPRHPNTLQKPNRKLGGEEGGAGGSSNGARRVMNWFRSRGKDRGA